MCIYIYKHTLYMHKLSLEELEETIVIRRNWGPQGWGGNETYCLFFCSEYFHTGMCSLFLMQKSKNEWNTVLCLRGPQSSHYQKDDFSVAKWTSSSSFSILVMGCLPPPHIAYSLCEEGEKQQAFLPLNLLLRLGRYGPSSQGCGDPLLSWHTPCQLVIPACPTAPRRHCSLLQQLSCYGLPPHPRGGAPRGQGSYSINLHLSDPHAQTWHGAEIKEHLLAEGRRKQLAIHFKMQILTVSRNSSWFMIFTGFLVFPGFNIHLNARSVKVRPDRRRELWELYLKVSPSKWFS